MRFLNLITLLLTSLRIWSARRRHAAPGGRFLQNDMWQYESALCECWVCVFNTWRTWALHIEVGWVCRPAVILETVQRDYQREGKAQKVKAKKAWKPDDLRKRLMHQLLISLKCCMEEQKHASRSRKATHKDQGKYLPVTALYVSDPFDRIWVKGVCRRTQTHTSQHTQQKNTNPTKAAWRLFNSQLLLSCIVRN